MTVADESEIVKTATAALREKRPLRHPRLKEAAAALHANRAAEAERLLAQYIERHPDDAGGLLLLAETALRLGRKEHAATLLARCVSVSPDYEAARFLYASTLYQLNRLADSLAELEHLLAVDPQNVLYLDMKAAVLGALARHDEALLCRRALADDHPNSSELRAKYGRALRSTGQRDAAVAAFRDAIALDPRCGSAWWSLADLKTLRFSDSDIAAMETALPEATGNDRMYMHFALGRAWGDRGDYPKSFEHYARGNAMKRLTVSYDADWLTKQVARCKALFTREFFTRRESSGCESRAPVFIVGMQRAGSTLIEQILGSHSAIEATAELPDITLLAERLAERAAGEGKGAVYPELLAGLDGGVLRQLGESYLETTRPQRRLRKPFFLDKNPYNFLHVGLIRLILPEARIVDVRRHPLACCWSNFSAHYETGALFAYRMGELGRAYADYVALMAHFGAVLPGRIHRIVYDNLVGDPEGQIRRLLEHLGLPFEAACLQFHANPRAMNSVSSEQVRQPLYSHALEQWRDYEPWLGPLKAALGPALESWR